jgi:Mg-chelatase subunit ChlD
MRRIGRNWGWGCLVAVLVCGMGLPVWAEGFSSGVEGLTAVDFPQIALQVRVFSPEPIVPTSDMFELHEMETRIATFDVQLARPQQFVVLVLDRSSSMEPVMGLVKQSASSFVTAISPRIPTSLLSFASDIDLGSDFMKDAGALQKEIGKLRPWGGTALYDALYKSCELICAKAGKNDVKTIVCLTDGKDESPRGEPNFSTRKPPEIARYATRNGIRIITVGLGTNLDTHFMTKIAELTGGWYLHSPSIQELTKVFGDITRKIMMEQRFQFRYQTPNPNPDGTRRDVLVTSEIKGQKDQGKGFYVAPKTLPREQPVVAGGERRSGGEKVSLSFRDFDLSGPDVPYLTGPILPGPAGPVHGPNGASFLGLSTDEAEQLLQRSEEQVRREHAANLKRQTDYLDGFLAALDRMLKQSEEAFAQSSQAEYEQRRLEYRRGVIASRRREVELVRQRCQAEHDIDLEANLKLLGYQRQEYVEKVAVPDNVWDVVWAWRQQKTAENDARFDLLEKQLETEEEAFSKSFDAARGSHVINETETTTTFSVGNSSDEDEVKESEDENETDRDSDRDADDEDDEGKDDDDDASRYTPPDVSIPDMDLPKIPGVDD